MIGPEEGVMQSRAQAMAAILELLTDQPLIVCNGFPSREAHKLRDRPPWLNRKKLWWCLTGMAMF